ncbi:hypothetical protein, partial [Stenotrophomonas maltophilia]|uniref:hypothetical protein n=1 Tax=Stenotrophomonas maltophilia TaxID=40324 RepID=UPI00296F5D2C
DTAWALGFVFFMRPSGRQYMLFISTEFGFSAPVGRGWGLVFLFLLPAWGRKYKTMGYAKRFLFSGGSGRTGGSAGRWPATP